MLHILLYKAGPIYSVTTMDDHSSTVIASEGGGREQPCHRLTAALQRMIEY